ncbi:PE-PGRS family protein PE_PGRS5-like isoform X2 [Dreissena polymorpha]|uniref:PE-PGRS family protein PE_PGRS5-like isoform X2 n=1 Tax=Dreissena polymorpha TaxID=45954 RepID=UPI0022653432|nr:PE-PGRS family protein PE_PGRS5-like isoform X2 [Dreissena polymorpha]
MFKHFIIVCILVFVWRFYRTSDYSSHIPDCETIDMEDSKDTVIVIGCGKLKGPQFIELFKGVGPIKVADDGNTLARINLQRQDGIVTYQNSELAKKAIATLNGKNVEGGKIEVVSAEQHFRDQTQRNGHCTGANTAWRMWEHSTTSGGGEGGKGGSGFFGFFRGQDGQPGEPGPNGRGGEGGKGGAGFFGGLFGGGGQGEKGRDQTGGGGNTEQSDNSAGKGGKGGAGMFGLFKGQDGQPGEPGPNGRGGEGGKGGGSR